MFKYCLIIDNYLISVDGRNILIDVPCGAGVDHVFHSLLLGGVGHGGAGSTFTIDGFRLIAFAFGGFVRSIRFAGGRGHISCGALDLR